MSTDEEDIHVWQIRIDDARWDNRLSVLSPDEEERAHRYRTTALQQTYRRCRSALRLILETYCGLPAQQIEFCYGAFGKPFLSNLPWHFNLSHSGKLCLIAISRQPIGVDVELTDPMRYSDALLDLVCHQSEKAYVARLSPRNRLSCFYQLWTHKEAYSKAIGIGLGLQLAHVYFDRACLEPVLCVRDGSSVAHSPYHVHRISPAVGYAASVCVGIVDPRISLFAASDEVRDS
jgi:4'-phosphopantetheinyl transferase